MPEDSATDVARLSAVLELAKAQGARLSSLIVGDIKLQFAGGWPEREPTASQSNEEAKETADLQSRSRRTFGRLLPVEVLRQYAADGLL